MTLSQRQVFELCKQFAALHDGYLEEAVAKELEQRILQDHDARRLYVRYMRVCAGLAWDLDVGTDRANVAEERLAADIARLQAEAQTIAGHPARPAPVDRPVPQSSPGTSPILGFLGDVGRQGWGFVFDQATLFSLLAVLVAAAALAIAFAWKGQVASRKPDAGSEIADRQPEISNLKPEISNLKSLLPAPAVARLTRVVDGCWGQSAPVPELGSAFGTGQKISLCSGAIELVFDVGVCAVVQGPAKLDLVAPGKVFLHAGKISAEIMKPEARGFEVETPKGSVVDLGTEFAVDVTPSEDVQVHVFKGEVVVEQPSGAQFAGPQPEGALKPAPNKDRVGQHLFVDQGMRMEGGRVMPSLVKDSGETFIRTIDEAQRDRHVVAYWRFEDQPLGSQLPDTAKNTKPVRATVDSSFNGNDLYTFMLEDRPTFDAGVPAGVIPQTGSPNRSCLDTRNLVGLRNVYTHSEFSHAAPLDIQKITPAQWTIEASVNSAGRLGEVQTFVGRDTHFSLKGPADPARLAFQINCQRRFAIAYFDRANRLHEAIGEEPLVEANRWYHVAATSDGRALRLYVDNLDGRGYLLRASTELPGDGATALGKGDDDAEWTIGRGWKDPHAGNRFQGLIDEVRVSDVALSPSEFLFSSKGQGKN